MKQISFEKSDNWMYEGRHGYSYSCGLNVLHRPGQQALRIEVVNSKGLVGPCSIEFPISKAQEFANLILSTAAAPMPGVAQEENSIPSVEQLMDQFGPWGEHDQYDREQWKTDVLQGNTQRGYWNWVAAALEEGKQIDALLSSPDSVS